METFHFLRPWWLLGLIPLAVLGFLLYRRAKGTSQWEDLCDAHLIPHVLVGTGATLSTWPLFLVSLGWCLAIVALAGPAWSSRSQPLFRTQSPLFVVLDLSQSMDAQDVRPSRLTRARHKVLDILRRRKEGQTGLIVYAADPYVVSPLTDDTKTIAAMIPALQTDLMPVQGSRADLALRKADHLLEQSGLSKGHLLLITDEVDKERVQPVFPSLREKGRQISIIGVGTAEGAPIPLREGGFLKDGTGSLVIPQLDSGILRELARLGGGRYADLTVGDQDLEWVLPEERGPHSAEGMKATKRSTVQWQEEGPWLVVALLLLAAPAFRQGWIGMIIVVMAWAPAPARAFSWDDLWANQDQQGVRALTQHEPVKAAQLFTKPEWQGVANYRAGRYDQAAKAFSKVSTADGRFNLGNALAKQGKLQEALQAYQAALKKDPDHRDAKFNYELVKKLLDQQRSSSKSKNRSGDTGQPHDNHQKNSKASTQASHQSVSNHHQSQRSQGQQRGSQKEELPGLHKEQPDKNSMEASSRKQKEFENNKSQPAHSRATTSQTNVTHRKNGKSPSKKPQMGESKNNPVPKTSAAPGISSHQQKKQRESQQALQQWLNRIPDDPGGLLRAKFFLKHQQRLQNGDVQQEGGKRW